MEKKKPDASTESPIPQLYKTMVAGGVAGSTAKTFTAPLSRITIMYQVSSVISLSNSTSRLSASLSSGTFSGSLRNALTTIIREEGLLSLWKGNLTSVLHRFPYSAINFTAYERSRDFFVHHLDMAESSGVRFASGAFAGMVACFACYPLDLVRTRLTIMRTAACGSKPAGIINSFKHIIEEEGLRGLYRGVSISIAVSVPNLAISFSVYGAVKEKMLSKKVFTDTHSGHISPLGSMLAGALSGLCTSAIVFPVDVVRRRMQVIGALEVNHIPVPERTFPPSATSVKGAINSMAKILDDLFSPILRGNAGREAIRIFRTEGVRGFYRGIVPELLKVSPMVAITFCTYEFVLEILMRSVKA